MMLLSIGPGIGFSCLDKFINTLILKFHQFIGFVTVVSNFCFCFECADSYCDQGIPKSVGTGDKSYSLFHSIAMAGLAVGIISSAGKNPVAFMIYS